MKTHKEFPPLMAWCVVPKDDLELNTDLFYFMDDAIDDADERGIAAYIVPVKISQQIIIKRRKRK